HHLAEERAGGDPPAVRPARVHVRRAAVMAEPTVRELFDLTGRVALVTGGTGHLGSAMGRALAEAGATVVVTSRDADRARAAAAAAGPASSCSARCTGRWRRTRTPTRASARPARWRTTPSRAGSST